MHNSIFNQFTNLYSLTKTLRFELIPTPETKSLADVIAKDKEIDRLYNMEMKPMLDALHERFITDSLKIAQLPDDLLTNSYALLSQIRILGKDQNKNRDAIKKIQADLDKKLTELRNELVKCYQINAKEYKQGRYKDVKLKKDGYKILTEEAVLGILLLNNPDKIQIIDQFKKFTTYFSGYHKNRENYYASDAKSTSIANRTINENLVRFMSNKYAISEVQKFIPQLDKYDDYFNLTSYVKFMTQSGIESYNLKIGELNKYLNQFAQQNKEELKSAPRLNPLYKQIGCGAKKDFIFEIKDGEEWQKLQEFIDLVHKKQNQEDVKLDDIRELYNRFFENADQFDLTQIYINSRAINTLSSKWFINWYKLGQLLSDKKVKITRLDKKNDTYSTPQKISLADLQTVLMSITSSEEYFRKGKIDVNTNIGEYEKCFGSNAWETFLNIYRYEVNKVFDELASKLAKFEIFKNEKFSNSNKDHISLVKDICDALNSIQQMAKYHFVNDFENIDNKNFYNILNLENIQKLQISKYYDAFRNRITKKDYREDKIKLNFDIPTLGNGFDLNKENEYRVIILRNHLSYYIGIIDKTQNNPFDIIRQKTLYDSDHFGWEKLIYNYFPDVSKMIPKCTTQLKEVKNHFAKSESDYILSNKSFSKPLVISKAIFDMNNKYYDRQNIDQLIKSVGDEAPKNGVKIFQKEFGKLSTDKTMYSGAVNTWIHFCYDFLLKYKKCEQFDYSKLKDLDSYTTIDSFYADVDRCNYECKFISINAGALRELVKVGQIYLFKLHNKDFNDGVKQISKKNIDTLLLENLFDQNRGIKLNGQAEIFYREKSIDRLVDNTRSYKTDGFEVFTNQRYTTDKYFFHFSVTINFGESDNVTSKDFNNIINEVHLDLNCNILGIDRGEKHLMYYSLIDQVGNIISQGSYNIVNGVDYNSRLTQRAMEMKASRQSWTAIGKIRELKEGYISQVLHEIYKTVIDKNAVIALENLNSNFKLKRTAKVEQAIYKKFELALAKKLNYLILKDKSPTEIGGVLNAYQLTPSIKAGDIGNFEKSNQWGIMYYVRPDYTSAIDPITGWRKHIHINNTETNLEEKFKAKNIKVYFDNDCDCFKFIYDKWELFAYSGLERFYFSRNEKNPNGTIGNLKRYDLHNEFNKLFDGLDKSKEILAQFFAQNDKSKHGQLVFMWNLLNQIRNTDRNAEGDANDFIQSPIYSSKIKDFFDSRKASVYEQKYGLKLPNNGDANGAYNIARKGLLALRKVKANPDKPDLFISNDEWDNFASVSVK